MKFNECICSSAKTNLGVIQGSVLGPILFNIFVSDLTVVSQSNALYKYADDMELLVPEHSEVSMEDEFLHLQAWAVQNNLVINQDKTKEIVFHAPKVKPCILPPTLNNTEL